MKKRDGRDGRGGRAGNWSWSWSWSWFVRRVRGRVAWVSGLVAYHYVITLAWKLFWAECVCVLRTTCMRACLRAPTPGPNMLNRFGGFSFSWFFCFQHCVWIYRGRYFTLGTTTTVMNHGTLIPCTPQGQYPTPVRIVAWTMGLCIANVIQTNADETTSTARRSINGFSGWWPTDTPEGSELNRVGISGPRALWSVLISSPYGVKCPAASLLPYY